MNEMTQVNDKITAFREATAGGDPAAFTEAIGEVERDVRDHIDRLHRTLDRIARLHAGDRLFVSEQVADYLDRLRALGVSERSVHLERDLWIMMQALSPQTAEGWLTDKLHALDPPVPGHLPRLRCRLRLVTRRPAPTGAGPPVPALVRQPPADCRSRSRQRTGNRRAGRCGGVAGLGPAGTADTAGRRPAVDRGPSACPLPDVKAAA
ncbi:hypothetical protein ACFQO7_11770 [Catellatospora aurea]|uniref:Hemerythrin HHE cation binding domain-containing protein n=1 Tax=Catellatospora aurea TaxID=1337874 RepID=A0ABW2GXU7_9ACTN